MRCETIGLIPVIFTFLLRRIILLRLGISELLFIQPFARTEIATNFSELWG